jgi:hypothetical protein
LVLVVQHAPPHRLVKVVLAAHHRLAPLCLLMAVAVAAAVVQHIVWAAAAAAHFLLAAKEQAAAQLRFKVDLQQTLFQLQILKTAGLVAAAQQQQEMETLLMAAVQAQACPAGLVGVQFTAAAAVVVVMLLEHQFLAVQVVVLPQMGQPPLAAAVETPLVHYPVQALVVKHVFGGSSNVTFCNH